MAITGQANINVGEENQAAGSDSLYSAFNKAQNNFTTLFSLSSPYTSFIANSGQIGVEAGINVTTAGNTVTFRNTGVTALVAGTGVSLSSATGCVTISMANASGNGGTVTSVGLTSPTNTLSVSGVTGNIVSAGVFNVDLSTVADVAGTYFNPNLSVDQYGRITRINSQTSPPNTLSSVTINPGTGISVSRSGPASAPIFTVTNSGVAGLTGGTGIRVTSDANGVYTVTNLLAGGGVAGSVTGVTVTTGTNIRLGTAVASATPANRYSSSSAVSFALDLANVITVDRVTTNLLNVNQDATVTGNVNCNGINSGFNGLTAEELVVTNIFVLPQGNVPLTSSSAGVRGQVAFADGFVYICINNNQWQRAPLSSW